MEIRGTDIWGSGAFGAPRGKHRKHNGIDIITLPGTYVYTYSAGVISRIGYAYADDLSYRYIELITDDYDKIKYFYVLPLEELYPGDFVEAEKIIGTAQDLEKRYPGITPHIHIEVLNMRTHQYINPEVYINELRRK